MIQQAGDALMLPEAAEPTQGTLLYWLLGAAIALLPVQIELSADFRLAPSDFILALTVLLGLGVWRGMPRRGASGTSASWRCFSFTSSSNAFASARRRNTIW